MNEFNYAEFVVGDIRNRNKIFTTTEFKLNGIDVDCYRSLFLYNFDLKDFVNKTGSVKGFKGKHIADTIAIDFDGDDLQTVRNEVVNFCNYFSHMFDLPIDHLRLSFSGNKGFHVCIPIQAFCDSPIPKDNFFEIVKNIVRDIAGDFKFIDYSIYESKRLFRLLNTKNSKSGLYKIPLSFNELKTLSIQEIKSLAAKPRTIDVLPVSEIAVVKALNEVYQKWYAAGNETTKLISTNQNKRDEILEIFQNGVEESNRHASLIKITAMLQNKGLDYGFILPILEQWNKLNRPPLPGERLEAEAKRCYEDLQKNRKQDLSEVKIFSIQDAEREYREYIAKMDSVKVKTGFPSVDNKMRGIMPGETMCILGKTSIGKSAVLQNIGMNHVKVSNEPVLFFSLEMPITSVFERAFQIENDVSGYEIENDYKHGKLKNIQTHLLFTNLKNFYTITQSGLTLEEIKNLARFAEENIYRQKTGLILIDYLGLISGEGNDIYQQVSRIARSTKDLAKELNVPIIFLSQVNRSAKESYDELILGSARDSGAIDEASDFILGIWKDKEKENEKDVEIKMKVGILKNRKGGLGKTSLTMSKRSLKIIEAAYG